MAIYTLSLNLYFAMNANIFFKIGEDFFVTFWIPILIVGIYSLVVGVLLLGLSLYHTLLALKNQTTSEELREKYDAWGGNPYSYGDYSWKNWQYFW